MEISSKELGKILIAFGKTLLDSQNHEVSHDVETEKTCREVVTGDINGGATSVISGSFEEPIGTPETAESGITTNDRDRISELEQELAKLQANQNQSGLDLKPIKL